MKFDTATAADYAGKKLDCLLERATRDTAEAVEHGNIPEAVTYFSELRDTIKDLQTRMSALQSHIDSLSQELIPTMFMNQSVKTIKVENIGRVTINDRWSAKMLNKDACMSWLRGSGNSGLIIETVNSQTLGAFGKNLAMEGKPLPQELFQVGATPYTSITKI
jgi:hypothetical protein